MAHIPDGVLATPVLTAGALISVGLLAISLRRLDYERLPQAAVLSDNSTHPFVVAADCAAAMLCS